LSIIYTRSVTMPSRWPSDLISFLRGIINPDQQTRIDTFEKFQQHQYMERMKWSEIFDRFAILKAFIYDRIPFLTLGEWCPFLSHLRDILILFHAIITVQP
jgi:hypothetical protein